MRRLTVLLALAGACSCSESSPDADADADAAAAPKSGESAPAFKLPPPPPAYGPEVRSLRLRRSIGVRMSPSDQAGYLGTVARDTRVEFRGAVTGPGCEGRWVEIVPRGWVCDAYLEPSKRVPRGVELPKLDRGDIVPGRFGKLVSEDKLTYKLAKDGEEPAVTPSKALEGSVTVRERGIREVEGTRYWHIGGGDWVREEDVRIQKPARHVGVRLADETGLALPLAFAVSKKDPVHRVKAFTSPKESARARPVLARTVITISNTALGPDSAVTHYELGENRWVRAEDVRFAERSKPPRGTLPGERWVDVDLDSQILVAYEGETPVYATLVSTGRRAHATETGIYRVWIKFAETTMNGQMADEPSYSVATVPWTQFYAKDLALHTAYWHDKFGVRKSHGCVNLSPRDARFLYFWSSPAVPRGWSMAHGNEEVPGSMVRVRSKKDPNPAFKGYAKKVLERRRAAEGG